MKPAAIVSLIVAAMFMGMFLVSHGWLWALVGIVAGISAIAAAF